MRFLDGRWVDEFKKFTLGYKSCSNYESSSMTNSLCVTTTQMLLHKYKPLEIQSHWRPLYNVMKNFYLKSSIHAMRNYFSFFLFQWQVITKILSSNFIVKLLYYQITSDRQILISCSKFKRKQQCCNSWCKWRKQFRGVENQHDQRKKNSFSFGVLNLVFTTWFFCSQRNGMTSGCLIEFLW